MARSSLPPCVHHCRDLDEGAA